MVVNPPVNTGDSKPNAKRLSQFIRFCDGIFFIPVSGNDVAFFGVRATLWINQDIKVVLLNPTPETRRIHMTFYRFL